MTLAEIFALGTIATSAYCIIRYGSNPFALLGILPVAIATAMPGGYITANLVSRLDLPEGPNGGIAMVIIIFSFIGGAVITGLGTFIILAKYFS